MHIAILCWKPISYLVTIESLVELASFEEARDFGILLLPRLLQVLDSWFIFDIEPLKFAINH